MSNSVARTVTALALMGCCAAGLTEQQFEPKVGFQVGTFLEGVVFDLQGNGYVSATREGRIYRFKPGEQPHIWATSEHPSGHAVLSDGTHVVADRFEKSIIRFSADGSRMGVVTRSGGKLLKAPNDIASDNHGGYYFTDMRDSYRGDANGEIHFVSASGEAVIVAAGLSAPNGLILSSDGKRLYVCESRTNHILVFTVTESNQLEEKKLLADLSSVSAESGPPILDGMTIDTDDTVYVAYTRTGMIFAVDSVGNVIGQIPSGMELVANVTFAPDEDVLYMVGSSDVERTEGALTSVAVSELRTDK